jgi:hypothetical protein
MNGTILQLPVQQIVLSLHRAPAVVQAGGVLVVVTTSVLVALIVRVGVSNAVIVCVTKLDM